MRGRPPTVYNCVCGGIAEMKKTEAGFYFCCEHDPGLVIPAVYTSPGRAAQAWNQRQQKMDNCDRQAVCAYHKRQSYGQYVAGIPVPLPAVRFPKGQPSDRREPHCVNCGMVIPPEAKNMKYCSEVCAEEARSKKKTEGASPSMLSKKETIKVCIRCGKPIPAHDSRRKYCSAECAEQA